MKRCRTEAIGQDPQSVVTFDDGYANNLGIALPVLEELGIPAILYVSTGPVLTREFFWPDVIWMSAKRSQLPSIDLGDISSCLGRYRFASENETWQKDVMRLLEDIKKTGNGDRRNVVALIADKFRRDPSSAAYDISSEKNIFTPLTEDQLRELSGHPLITIGAHTHDHELLDRAPLFEAQQSITKSRTLLEQMTGKPIVHFAYPNGNYNDDLMHMVEGIGFKSALSFKAGLHRPSDNKYAIKRIGIGSDISIDLFRVFTVGMFDLKWRLGN